MGQPSVTQAVGYLTAAGIRADRGYPGKRMPHLTGPVAAVNIRQATDGKLTLTAAVCGPMTQGGAVCEDTAAKVAAAWTAAGALCSYGDCSFDGRSGLFTVTVQAVWEEPEETEEA